ncbi:zinc metallopeptidase [Pedobacter foliorum]|uniref:zinc metallopeptidase n=1 Tax=Pedobacter foliorum TaxID=2739058 RepID=UPI0015635735|nr:zinc metallopeptidase [Pedobacter foliorum]NRF37229.1 zinc metallopeptidase [Pedobacter foliorum]
MGLAGYYLIAGIMFVIGLIVSNRLKSKFAEYSQVGLRNGLSGKEIAEKMLQDNGIYNVRVISTPGHLSDHYNPEDRTVNLSEDVYYGRSVSAAAVAAHECGHAVQHATAYSMLKFRSAIVPLVNISSQLSQWIILIGLGFMFGAANPTVLLIGIVLFAVTTVFTVITLPVEYDASNRALRWLENNNMTTAAEHDQAADALKWAARTYVVAAISSVATLLYYILLFVNSRDRN